MKKGINPNITKVVRKIKPGSFKKPSKQGPPSNKATPVVSSNLKTVEYDPKLRVLTIVFHKGDRMYSYFGVPSVVYTRLMAAVSKGTFHDRYIKNIYKFKEIKGGIRGTK